MMGFDPPWARLARPTLAARRARARLMRVACALCAVIALVSAYALLDAMTATTRVAVAAHGLRRGDVIRASDVMMLEVPVSPAFDGAFTSVGEASGLVAQTDLKEFQPLFPTNARHAPVVPAGRTVLEVTVANDASMLIAGDVVSLVSAVACGETGTARLNDAGPDGAGTTVSAGTDDARTCVLSDDALVMRRASVDEDGSGAAVVPMAMTPQAALDVMASSELGAVVAVVR